MSEDWLHESSERGEFLNQKDYLIGGSEAAKRMLTREFTDPNEEEKIKVAKESGEKKMKLVMKVPFFFLCCFSLFFFFFLFVCFLSLF